MAEEHEVTPPGGETQAPAEDEQRVPVRLILLGLLGLYVLLFIILNSGSVSVSFVFFSTKSAIGTPQARCRLMTQSGRCSTIAPSRLRPFSGTKRVSAMA